LAAVAESPSRRVRAVIRRACAGVFVGRTTARAGTPRPCSRLRAQCRAPAARLRNPRRA